MIPSHDNLNADDYQEYSEPKQGTESNKNTEEQSFNRSDKKKLGNR